MILENLSRNELKELAKEKGLVDYANLNRAQLVRLLNPLDEIEGERSKEKVTKILREIEVIKPLSSQAKKWQLRLKQINISPVDFLVRYPDHVNKKHIQELI